MANTNNNDVKAAVNEVMPDNLFLNGIGKMGDQYGKRLGC